MGLFGTKTASLTWNSKGECFGVLMSKEGQKYKVLNYWYEKASNADSIAPVLQKGYSSLGVGENDFLVVGEMGMKCSFADIDQPLMSPKDMKKSLGFSLSSHFPMDPVDLQWSYRVVEQKKGVNQAVVRLMALKKKVWNDWIDHIGTLKVDKIIAPSSVCDAVLDEPVYIAFNAKKGFILSHNDEGRLQSKAILEENAEGVFGAGEDPLDHELLDTTVMDELDSSTQQKFSEAILLAVYGLTPYLAADKDTAFETPKSIVPKRNVATQTLCVVLGIFLLLLGIFQGARIMAFKKNEAAQIDIKIGNLKKETKLNTIDQELLTNLGELEAEMTTKIERPVSAKDILVVLTETLPDDFYVTNFSLRNDKITCRIVQKEGSEREPEDLYDIFKKEPFFDNDVLFQPGSKDYSLTLKVAPKVNHEKEENN